MTVTGDADDYVIVDLPLRLRPAELTQLRQALSSSAPTEASRDGSQRVAVVQAERGRMNDLHAQRDYARKLLDLRRRRERELGVELFSDPSWDILLDLFVQQIDGKAISASGACFGSSAPQTTAFRHLTLLIESGLIGRKADVADKRRHYVYLTEDGFTRMQRLLAKD